MIKKKKILLGTLIPLSVLGVGLAIVLPLTLKSCSDKWITFKSYDDIERYVNTHLLIHDGDNDDHDWSDKASNDLEITTYFWNRENCGIQNMLNASLLAIGSDPFDWVKIKITNTSFMMEAWYHITETFMYQNKAFDGNFVKGVDFVKKGDTVLVDSEVFLDWMISAFQDSSLDWKWTAIYHTVEGTPYRTSGFANKLDYPKIKLPYV